MSIGKYIKDKALLIVFFTGIIIFLRCMIFFDSSIKMEPSNGTYTISVCGTLFLFYLVLDYLKIYFRFKRIEKIKNDKDLHWINSIPKGINNEEEFYFRIIRQLYKSYNKEMTEVNHRAIKDLEFVTTWVHEIKTPIAATRLIIENNVTRENEGYLNAMNMEIKKVENYVQQALFYSRINDIANDYFIVTICFRDIVTELLKEESIYFINKNIKIELEHLELHVDSDYKWLKFILKQILDNGIKYSRYGGTIKIYGEDLGNKKVLYIEDDGIGIIKEDISRVFNKSFTGHNGRINKQSTGMGLYISKKIAKKLCHDIKIISQQGVGTRVAMEFYKFIL